VIVSIVVIALQPDRTWSASLLCLIGVFAFILWATYIAVVAPVDLETLTASFVLLLDVAACVWMSTSLQSDV